VFEFAERRGWLHKLNVGMHIRSTNVGGFLLLRLLGGLRWWRPHSWRYQQEQARIEHWLAAVTRAVPRSLSLALEIANCGQLMKGYGDTHARAVRNFSLIADNYFNKAWADPAGLAQAIAAARKAALSDPEGQALDTVIASSANSKTQRSFAAAAE
jgi:indolepyruvate ferredoxin oxidoreductase beta subunit